MHEFNVEPIHIVAVVAALVACTVCLMFFLRSRKRPVRLGHDLDSRLDAPQGQEPVGGGLAWAALLSCILGGVAGAAGFVLVTRPAGADPLPFRTLIPGVLLLFVAAVFLLTGCALGAVVLFRR